MGSSTTTAHDSTATRQARVNSLLGALIAALIILALTARIDLYEHERAQTEVRVDTVRYASVVRARLESALNARLHLAYGLAAYARSHPVDLSGFDAFAEGLMHSGISGLRSLQLAPRAIVSYVYPLEGNEKAIGHNILADPQRRDAVLRAINDREFVVAGPFPLIQGGNGMVARFPLYLGPPGSDNFWGFATVVIDPAPIFAEGGLTAPIDFGFDTALRGKDALGDKGDVFLGNPAIFNASPVLLDVSLPHGSWQLAVIPVGGWPDTSPHSLLIWLAGAVLALFAAALAYTRLYAPAKLRAEVVRATTALSQSEEQFRNVAESATDAIVSVDSRGNATYWNSAAEGIFLYSAPEMIGRPVWQTLLPPRSNGHASPAGDDPSTEPPGKIIGLTVMRKDGHGIPAEMTISHWKQGAESYTTAIIRDISERKAAEREQADLKARYFQAQKMEAIGTLASGAAHEFNNILNTLLASAETAMADLPPGSPALGAMNEVLDAGWRAAEIVRRLLAFSENQDLTTTTTSPASALAKLMPQIQANLGNAIDLTTDIDKTSQSLRMEYDQFCHLTWNLCTNAVSAMRPSGGVLSIRLAEVGSDGIPPELQSKIAKTDGAPPVTLFLGDLQPIAYVRLSVSDTGCGMDSDTLSRAFEPFFTTAQVGEGSGLGLPTVLGIVQGHGGCIEVTTQPGHGTTIDVYLPALAADAPLELVH